MKPRTAILAAVLAAAAMGGAPRARGQVTGADFNVVLAEKYLGASDWGPTDRQGELGLLTNWQWRAWPVMIAGDFLAASRDSPISNGPYTDQTSHTFELDLGARKVWRAKRSWRPFVGLGPALAYANVNYTGSPGPQASNDSGGYGVGFWADGGVFWEFTDVFKIGVEGRYSAENVRLFGIERNAGGVHFGLLAGYHFGN
jgi:hypothetical protein